MLMFTETAADSLDSGAMLEHAKAHVTYDPATGEMHWILRTARKTREGMRAGTVSNGRMYVTIKNVKYSFPRLAWALFTGEMPRGHIDHIDGDPLNNRIANLRDVTQKVNSQNLRKAKAHNRVGLLGVRPARGNKFSARVTVDGREMNLGVFSTPEEAHAAYVDAKREVHEGCTL